MIIIILWLTKLTLHAPLTLTAEDTSSGALIRYTPSQAAYSECWPTETPDCNKYGILSSTGGSYEYLVLSGPTNGPGAFSWTTNRNTGESNANSYFPNSEGITVHNRMLDFVSKSRRRLYTLDLAAETWVSFDLTNPSFSIDQPDQLARMFDESNYLFFCEDAIAGTRADIFGKDLTTNQYFTLIQASTNSALGENPLNLDQNWFVKWNTLL